MSSLQLYATDEDLAIRAPSDFVVLCPRDQRLAEGADGFFEGSDRWTLQSSSVDFAAAGLAPGHVVQLVAPSANFRPPGEVLAIDSVGIDGVRLRRKGESFGVGLPPSPPGGLLGVQFLVPTLDPQIRSACDELNRRYRIDDTILGRRPDDLQDFRGLCHATCLIVLRQRFIDLSRTGDDEHDAFAAKAVLMAGELDDLLANLAIQWNGANGGNRSVLTSSFTTRLLG